MDTHTQIGRLFGSIALVALGCTACSTSTMPNAAYVTDTNGHYVRDGMGQCVRTIHWTAAAANADCDSGLMMKPVAVAKPMPAAAPMAAPAPAPAPAAESWKTTLIAKPVRLEGATFATGSAKLGHASDAKLDEVVDAAKQHPEVKLAVSGYTDNAGNAQKNLKLSHARAEAVKDYLVKKGVAADRISAKGYGEENPIASNKTKAGRAENRRVEVNYTLEEQTRVRVVQ